MILFMRRGPEPNCIIKQFKGPPNQCQVQFKDISALVTYAPKEVKTNTVIAGPGGTKKLPGWGSGLTRTPRSLSKVKWNMLYWVNEFLFRPFSTLNLSPSLYWSHADRSFPQCNAFAIESDLFSHHIVSSANAMPLALLRLSKKKPAYVSDTNLRKKYTLIISMPAITAWPRTVCIDLPILFVVYTNYIQFNYYEGFIMNRYQ